MYIYIYIHTYDYICLCKYAIDEAAQGTAGRGMQAGGRTESQTDWGAKADGRSDRQVERKKGIDVKRRAATYLYYYYYYNYYYYYYYYYF